MYYKAPAGAGCHISQLKPIIIKRSEMTLPITTHCPLFASDFRKAAYLKGERVSQLRLFHAAPFVTASTTGPFRGLCFNYLRCYTGTEHWRGSFGAQGIRYRCDIICGRKSVLLKCPWGYDSVSPSLLLAVSGIYCSSQTLFGSAWVRQIS